MKSYEYENRAQQTEPEENLTAEELEQKINTLLGLLLYESYGTIYYTFGNELMKYAQAEPAQRLELLTKISEKKKRDDEILNSPDYDPFRTPLT